MNTFLQDLRYGLKSLRGTPRLTFAALACIALGIGSAVFMGTLINSVLLRRPPFPDAERLVRVWAVSTTTGETSDLSYLDFQDIKKQARSFEAIETPARTRQAIMADDGTERMRGEAVTPGYFDIIGLKPALGRFFTQEEYAPNGDRVIVISHDMWQRKYGGRPDIVGQVVRARSTSEGTESIALHTIVGVMPSGFIGTVDTDISDFWIPAEHFTPRSLYENRRTRHLWPIARLKPGVSLAAAQAELQQIGSQLAAEYPESYEEIRLGVEPFGESWRRKFRTGLLMLMGAAVLLMLIACTNIANLLLARLVQREHELTLRMVLGAQRNRILRQLLTESLLMSSIGGIVGALLAFLGIKLFVAANVIKLPTYVKIAPDWRVILLTVVLVLFTGILFGVLPAWFGARINASQNLREASRNMSMGRRQRSFGQLLVVLEVSFTFVLLIGSVLMLRTYLNLVNSDLGYRTENLLRMAVSLDPTAFPDARSQLNFVRDAKAKLGAQPGVSKVTFIAGILPPWFDNRLDVALDGVPNEALKRTSRHAIDPDFLETLDISLKQGRNFLPSDRADTPRVGIVSESLASFMARGDSRGVLGKKLQLVVDRETQELSPPIEIVGVVEDVRYHGPLAERQIDYDLYVPIEQAPESTMSLALLTTVDPASLIPSSQQQLGQLAPTSPQHWISTMKDELALQYGDARFYAYLTGVYAVCAMLLAVLGIYSVLANSVSRRFGELGIRMAIGAQAGDIVRLILGQGFRTLAFGLVVGAVLAALGTKLMASLLFGVAPGDPVSFVLVASALLLLGMIACYLPARRATRADPMVILRGE
jgi:putative ABC transport system permease protein